MLAWGGWFDKAIFVNKETHLFYLRANVHATFWIKRKEKKKTAV